MTPAEALKGATVIAAGRSDWRREIGSLEPGKAADFAVIDAPDVDHWLYHLRPNACRLTVAGGVSPRDAPMPSHRSDANLRVRLAVRPQCTAVSELPEASTQQQPSEAP